MNIEFFRKIPFPPRDSLDWTRWPCIPVGVELPPDMEYWFAGDMLQIGVVWKSERGKVFITDDQNCIGLLQHTLEVIFAGTFTWYDLGNSIGVCDYFWYSYSIESDCKYIREMPKWCQDVWKILLDEEIISSIKDTETSAVYYYVEDAANLSKIALNNAYQKLLPIFIKEMISYQTEIGEESEIDSLLTGIENAFSALIASL